MALAETIRIATYNADLSQRGPGLLYAKILKGDPQVQAVQAIIAANHPDILLLTGFDYDAGQVALTAFASGIAERGLTYPHLFALRPNTGMATGLDLDGDRVRGGPGDAQGWGRFSGADGMALLSRYPINAEAAQDFSALLWRDLPGAELPEGMAADVATAQRLSTTGHWDVPVTVPGGDLHLLAYYATPPVFDGPEDRNGLRNAAETAFWVAYIGDRLATPGPVGPFVILGDANLDPVDGDGRGGAMQALLSHPSVQDPKPASDGGRAAANPGQTGDPALDTADWPDEAGGPGNLRADYVLPSASLSVTGSGIFWPAPGDPDAALLAPGGIAASRHRLVWVDITLP